MTARPETATAALWPVLAAVALLAAPPTLADTTPELGFDIAISLSPKAQAALDAAHEQIALSAVYYGDPRPGEEKHANEVGMIDLGMEDAVLPAGVLAVHVTGRSVTPERLRLIRGGPMVNVNVFSARKSSDDNILNCDFIDGAVAAVVAGPVSLHCFLISENAETSVRP